MSAPKRRQRYVYVMVPAPTPDSAWQSIKMLPHKGRVIVHTDAGAVFAFCRDVAYLCPPATHWMPEPASPFAWWRGELEPAA